MKKVMKKMNVKLLALMMVLVLVGGFATGCGSSYSDTTEAAAEPAAEDYGFDTYNSVRSYDESYDSAETKSMDVESAEESADGAPADEAGVSESTDVNMANAKKSSAQKIIKRYDYDYETEHFDEAYAYLKNQVDVYGGYVSSSQIRGGGSASDYRTLYMTARIPAEDSEKFVSELGKLGTVVRQSESAEDVTLQYSDTESRIKALEIEQERLNALLEKADSLETIIALEDRLTEVRYELENYQSRKKVYDDLISYSTIDITLEEVNYTVEVDDGTFFSRIMTGLERSLRDVGSGFVGFVEWFIINLPYFIVWGLIIFGLVKLIRAIRKKSKAKKLKKQQMKEEQKQKAQKQEEQAQENQAQEEQVK